MEFHDFRAYTPGDDPALIDWLDESDIIIHETNEGIHTPYGDLAALPKAQREKMRLIHYPDNLDLKRSRIPPLAQGREYSV